MQEVAFGDVKECPLRSMEGVDPAGLTRLGSAADPGRAVAGYESESNLSYKIPSLALKWGHSLAKVAAGPVQCNGIIANVRAVAESAKQCATQ